jgi:hypothetical protein
MATNFVTNMDSPVYGGEINQKGLYTESEVILFKKVNNSYNEIIVTDGLTAGEFFCHLKREEGKIASYLLTPHGDMNWEYVGCKLVIWRKISLTRPVKVRGPSKEMLLGNEFKTHLDRISSCIYDTGEAKAYL